jgi:hypothetical protein
MKKRNKEQ